MKIIKFVVFIFCSVAAHVLDCALQLDVGNVQFAIVPALIGAGALLASTAASIVSSKKNANKANAMSLNMQREQNAWNLEQWNRERAFTEEMWNKENEYNSAKNQRKRLEEAGLNPYLMLNGGSAGVAEGVSTPSGHPAASAFTPAVSDPNLIQSGIQATGNMFSQLVSTKKQLAENRIAEVDAQYKEQQILAGLVKLSEETANLRGDTRKKAQETINLAVDEQLKRAAQRVENFNVEHLDQRWSMEVERFDSDMSTARVLRKVQLDANNREDQRLAVDIQHTMALITKAFAEADLAAANKAVSYAQKYLLDEQGKFQSEKTKRAAEYVDEEIKEIGRRNQGKFMEGKNLGEYISGKWNEIKEGYQRGKRKAQRQNEVNKVYNDAKNRSGSW